MSRTAPAGTPRLAIMMYEHTALCGQFARAFGNETFEPLAPLVLREITYRVLTGPQGPRLRQIASAGAPAQRIARAIRWLKDHFTDPLRVESLAKHARMSPSAFHLHFKGVTALSPLQYQKRLRLQEARRLMLGEGLDAAEAAFRVGYESPSQFSREYRRLFGAPPRQNIAALQVEAQPFLRPPGDEVQIAAHRPQEIGAAAEGAVFLRI